MPQDDRTYEQKDAENKARIAERNRVAHVEAGKRRKIAEAMSARLRRERDKQSR